MQAFIITTLIGIIAIDENKRVILVKPFSKDPSQAAEKYQLSQQDLIEEEKEVIDQLRKKNYIVEKVDSKNPLYDYVKTHLREIFLDQKIFKDATDFNKFLSQVVIELTKAEIKKAVSKDKIVIQLNGAIEEIDKSINIFVERLREWYGLHFPEMDRIISDHEKFAGIVEKFGSREKIEDQKLAPFKNKSMGMEFREEDIKEVQALAKQILELYKLKERFLKYLESLLKEIAPNFTELAGPILTAKFIAKAGGLEKLAKLPSSTIQLLGSEKALFRFLKGKGKSPKYGILFSHPLVRNSPEEFRGKVARALASKLSIAVKIDYFSKENKAQELRKELDEKVKEILSSK
ncbi:MAG: hypothetical protein QXQ18_01340 [Candidatus Aenigmatarchaeota archaeon]